MERRGRDGTCPIVLSRAPFSRLQMYRRPGHRWSPSPLDDSGRQPERHAPGPDGLPPGRGGRAGGGRGPQAPALRAADSQASPALPGFRLSGFRALLLYFPLGNKLSQKAAEVLPSSGSLAPGRGLDRVCIMSAAKPDPRKRAVTSASRVTCASG